MKAKTLIEHIIAPTLHHLAAAAPKIDSMAAKQFMLAVAAQETHCGQYFKQLGIHPEAENYGQGIWQVEHNTSQDIFDNYLRYKPKLLDLVNQLFTKANNQPHIQCPMYNCAIARLAVYRYKEPMPELNDKEGMWELYKLRYNSHLGAATKPHWVKNWDIYVKNAF